MNNCQHFCFIRESPIPIHKVTNFISINRKKIEIISKNVILLTFQILSIKHSVNQE